ncbi:hypothetical protein B0H16DRAFT_1304156 [Mycena metata]|uniref:G domain-containing protein n=1 Tax=Mycena metata TaxID=1033252 RepID=A0AAD7JXP3_9AGAR|nr:hypothetical protein B0H16DRAFT_1304156 [Mycena metata]
MNNIITLRSSGPHLRILVVGRTNAAKTTLLKRLCHSDENPEVFDAGGDAVLAKLTTPQRPPHDINNQLIFRSNPHTIFHVSRGFESGSGEEMDKVKKFITQRTASPLLAEKLHVIWYCLPTDTNRPFSKAEERFFNNDITGKVPVFVVFTKLDALRTQAFVQLTGQGVNLTRARELTTSKAQEMLNTHFQKYLMSTNHPPADYVPLDDLRKEHADCTNVLRATVKALSEDSVRLLFVSSQRNSVDLCINYVVAA